MIPQTATLLDLKIKKDIQSLQVANLSTRLVLVFLPVSDKNEQIPHIKMIYYSPFLSFTGKENSTPALQKL